MKILIEKITNHYEWRLMCKMYYASIYKAALFMQGGQLMYAAEVFSLLEDLLICSLFFSKNINEKYQKK